MIFSVTVSVFLALIAYVGGLVSAQSQKTCRIRPLGHGKDDSAQIQAAIAKCGHHGTTVLEHGSYNVTKKMKWDLVSSKVDLRGTLNFPANIPYWLNASNTYRVIFIQNQASWFVVTGKDFEIDAHHTGGIQGNGQAWWSYYANITRADGDGRPVSLSLVNVTRGVVRNFRIESPPFWANAVATSSEVTYDGMFVNATNEDPRMAGLNAVWNTDGIDTYRSDRISMVNWDISCGDDCIAVKGNSSNIFARNITCRGGTGIAIGSLGQYANLTDKVQNVELEDLRFIRQEYSVQPNMSHGIYFKSWTGSINGSPPNGGGAGKGFARNISMRNVVLDRVDVPIYLYQNNLGHAGDLPSQLKFSDLHFFNWTGTAITNKMMDFECSPAVGCSDISLENFHVSPPPNEKAQYICVNAVNVTGASCSSTSST